MPPADGSRGGPWPPQSAAARPLSPDDLNILALENETVAGHTCKVITLAGPLDLAALRSSIAGRLQQAPLLGLRLSDVDGAPWWVPDPDLEAGAQVVGHDLAGPLDEASLRTAVADIFGQHLDRSRPLWRIDVLPRLADGGSALIWRIHHALADGLTAMAMARAVLWDEQASSGSAVSPTGTGAAGAQAQAVLAQAGARVRPPATFGRASRVRPRATGSAGFASSRARLRSRGSDRRSTGISTAAAPSRLPASAWPGSGARPPPRPGQLSTMPCSPSSPAACGDGWKLSTAISAPSG